MPDTVLEAEDVAVDKSKSLPPWPSVPRARARARVCKEEIFINPIISQVNVQLPTGSGSTEGKDRGLPHLTGAQPH